MGAAEQIHKCSSTLAVVFELAQGNPGYSEHAGKVEGCKELLNGLHKVLLDSGIALKPEGDAKPPTNEDLGTKDDPGDVDDDEVEMFEGMDPPGAPRPGAPPPAGPSSGTPAHGPVADTQGSPCTSPAPPQPPLPPEPAASSPPPGGAPALAKPAASTSAKEKVKAALAANPAVAKNRDGISKAKTGAKVRNDKTKGASSTHTTGGATAPTPVLMQDTSEEAQDGDRIVDDEDAGAL